MDFIIARIWFWFSTGTLMGKTKAAFVLGWTLAPVMYFIEKYIFKDWSFAAGLAVLVILNALISLVWSFVSKSLDPQNGQRWMLKVIIYCAFLIATHVMTSLRIDGKASDIFAWLDLVVFSSLYANEFLVLVKYGHLSGIIRLPSAVISRLHQFADDGTYVQNANPQPPQSV